MRESFLRAGLKGILSSKNPKVVTGITYVECQSTQGVPSRLNLEKVGLWADLNGPMMGKVLSESTVGTK